MPIHCKFRSEKDPMPPIPCDDPTMSVAELKRQISVIKKWTQLQTRSFDLKLLDAVTKKEYGPDNLIPKNSSVIVMRVPLPEQQKKGRYTTEFPTPVHGPPEISSQQRSNLAEMECSEKEKVDLMIAQSTHSYAPSNYLKVPYKNSGPAPPSFVCNRCHIKGHWRNDCTFKINGKPATINKAHGIPLTMVKVVEGPEVPGAMITSTGEYVVFAPEMMLMKEERGKPKMPYPIRDLKLLREKEMEIKEEIKEKTEETIVEQAEDSSPPSSGVEDVDSAGSSSPGEPSDSSPWSSHSGEPLDSLASNSSTNGVGYYQQSSGNQYWQGDGSSYQQPTGYDQWGSNYYYQGCQDCYKGCQNCDQGCENCYQICENCYQRYQIQQTGYQQLPQQQYYGQSYYGYQTSGYDTQSEAIQEPATTFPQYSGSENYNYSDTRWHHSSRRSESSKFDSTGRYQESSHYEDRSAKKMRHSYSKRDNKNRY